MIYLRLFLTFLKIGAVSFGGGAGMFAVIEEEVLSNGWMTEELLLNFFAVSESTPGPIAVNIATFIGASQGGILGAFLATLGVVLPSFLIILLIAAVFKNFMRNRAVQGVLAGIRPVVVGMILAVAVGLYVGAALPSYPGFATIEVDYRAIAIACGLTGSCFFAKKVYNITLSPILIILVAAALGMIVYAV